MKTNNQLLIITFLMLFMFNASPVNAQDDEPKSPMYLSATTMYWSKDYEGNDEDWKAAEQEYMEKVTKKNEHVVWAGYYTHLFTENSNEVIYVQGYSSWEAMDKAAARNAELEKEAWPDEAARKEFLDKMNSAYSVYHSDEIMVAMGPVKEMTEEPTKDMVLYLRKNKWAFPEDGTREEYNALYKKTFDNVIMKNEYIKAYYPSRHAWGSDRRDFIEAVYIDSMDVLGKMFDRNIELSKEALTKEEWETMGKYFKSHGDYLYTWIHDIKK